MPAARGGEEASWVDYFSLSQLPAPSRALGKLCTTGPSGLAGGSSVPLLPGVDVLDLYGDSAKAEIWKDGQTFLCLVPRQVLGWEFYSLISPRPGGTSQLRLNSTIDLMVGRPAGGAACPSVVFAHIPAHHAYPPGQSGKANQQGGLSPQSCERSCGNLDALNRTLMPRVVVLCPSVVFKDAAKMPDEQHWGLFIGPRSRSLVLLNKQNGRIDLNFATLLAVDSAFRHGRDFIGAVAQLFEPFGCQREVPGLLAGKFDPMKVHSGLTSALVVDHVSISLDGREDYWRVFGIRLPTFFVSNASSNLRFFTHSEAQHLRAGSDPSATLPPSEPLPDMPVWTLAGLFTVDRQSVLHSYRERMPVQREAQDPTVGDGILQLLGLDKPRLGSGVWPFPSLAGCAEISMAGTADVSTRASTRASTLCDDSAPYDYTSRTVPLPREEQQGHGIPPPPPAATTPAAATQPQWSTVPRGSSTPSGAGWQYSDEHRYGGSTYSHYVGRADAGAQAPANSFRPGAAGHHAGHEPPDSYGPGPTRGHWPSSGGHWPPSGPPTPQPIEH